MSAGQTPPATQEESAADRGIRWEAAIPQRHRPRTHATSPPEWLRHIRLELAQGVKLINVDADKWVIGQGSASVAFRLPPGIFEFWPGKAQSPSRPAGRARWWCVKNAPQPWVVSQ